MADGVGLPAGAAPAFGAHPVGGQWRQSTLQARHHSIDELCFATLLPALLLQPSRVVDGFKRIRADGGEVSDRPGFGEEVIAKGFRNPEVAHDAGADAHGHGFQGRR